MNRLFEDFHGGVGWDLSRFGEAGGFSPDVEIEETDTELRLSVEIPGMDEKDIDVSLQPDSISIRGEKREEQEKESEGRKWTERSYGRFERRIPLPCEVEADKAEAKLRKGVLAISLPKSAQAREKARTIAISSE